jgi:cell division protein FtsL
MATNSKRKIVGDDTIRLQRVDGKMYRSVPHRSDATDNATTKSKKRNPWRTAFLGLIIVAAIVVALWWASHMSADVNSIKQGVAENGRRMAGQQQHLSGLQSQVSHLQHQFTAFSSWVHSSFAKLFGMLNRRGQ